MGWSARPGGWRNWQGWPGGRLSKVKRLSERSGEVRPLQGHKQDIREGAALGEASAATGRRTAMPGAIAGRICPPWRREGRPLCLRRGTAWVVVRRQVVAV